MLGSPPCKPRMHAQSAVKPMLVCFLMVFILSSAVPVGVCRRGPGSLHVLCPCTWHLFVSHAKKQHAVLRAPAYQQHMSLPSGLEPSKPCNSLSYRNATDSCPGSLYVSSKRYAWFDISANLTFYGPGPGGKGQVFAHSTPILQHYKQDSMAQAVLPDLVALVWSACQVGDRASSKTSRPSNNL
eukprot:GHUV01023053.1.p1 GENE.GHUV01023053.1~~GHUV01023053.1.p1  ORF type:complete len:184 (+),score=9.74 GHUV01023053.1:816-1367(+)